MVGLSLIMATQEQHNEWHLELRILCNMFIAAHNKKVASDANSEPSKREPIDFMSMFRQHFARVAVKQHSEMDGILGYEDMLDYAKWYVSDSDILEKQSPL
jgi:hypothetical protein